ncbi:amidase signature domain-containing protein [Whalleya microplaca]|nr:amidase signature domain-containing protein [Whalleya microplaca]
MSVFFKDVSPDNPVKRGHAEEILKKIGVGIDEKDSDDYHNLLAAVHDCAERLLKFPDYQPVPDEKRYPRENIHRPIPEEQEFGAAWAHKFFIKGNRDGGKLKGKTVCLKDCIAVAGVPQFFGSDAFPAWTPTTDATVVTRVLDAGADILGTATCENFCNSTSSFTSAQGTIDNPYAEGYSAGGSTSGGAALVSSGIVDVAIGTDQGGSIRVPSSLSGCVGFKPTHGLVPYTGITSGDAVDDHAGPVTRSVLEAAESLDAIAGYDGIDDRSLGAAAQGSFEFAKALEVDIPLKLRLDGVKVGILTEGIDQDIFQPQVRELLRSAATKMQLLGAVVEDVSVPLHLEGPAIWTIQQRISGAAGILGQAHGRRGLGLTEFEQARLPWTADNFAKLFPSTKNTVINGLYLSEKFPGLYSKTINIGRQIKDAYDDALRKYDVLVMPTTPYVAPKHGSRESPRTCFEPSIGLTTNTAVFNVTGHPALSIPIGFARAKEDSQVLLPVGMQIVGGWWQEKKVLRVGHAWESNFDWKRIKTNSEGSDQPIIADALNSLDNRIQPVQGRRRRGGATSLPKHSCPHCGRTFKRSEHLERHVRTHTKEKPYACHCGAAFTRRDLLKRHQRNTFHEPEIPDGTRSDESPETAVESDGVAAAAAAASLSDMSTNQWMQQPQYISNGQCLADTQDLPSHSLHQPLLGQDVFGQGQNITGFDHFKEFANFLDGVGLQAEWSPYFNGPALDNEPEDTASHQSRSGTSTPVPRGNRPGTPFTSWLPSAPTAPGIPPEVRSREVATDFPSFRVTEEQLAKLNDQLQSFRHVLSPDFNLPSRHTLTRYITSYFEGFHPHLPFIHVYTWRIFDCPLELVLAISTVGAQYCFEHRNSERLFFAGKAIVLERLFQEASQFGPRTNSFLGSHNYPPYHGSEPDRRRFIDPTHTNNKAPWDPINTVRALVILMGYATWEPKESQLHEAFALQSLLVHVLRDICLEETSHRDKVLAEASLHDTWSVWLEHESVRRTKLIAFTFLHTHSIAYNVYPVLRSNEIHLRLPCSTKEWKASSAAQWQAARQEVGKEQLDFQQALALLLRSSDSMAPLDPIPTPLGNYVLLHGLLQRIHIVRDLSLPVMDQTASLPKEEVNKLERALRSWTTGWQQAPESTLDPKNENGPIPFTSSSLLGLAYARIYLNLGPYRQLDTRNPTQIAWGLTRLPTVKRSDGVISALLYAAHALSIPVRLGVDRVARSQAFFWSVRHSLSALDCSVLLSKWLYELKGSIGVTPLSESEDRILHWVRCIVEEAYDVIDFDEDESGLQGDPFSLSLAVLKIWAHFFKGNTQWPFINMIGLSLEKYRELIRSGRQAI